MCIAGPSASGKTSLCVDLLNNADRMFELKFDKIFWVLGDLNAKPKNLTTKVEFLSEIPSEFTNDTGMNHLWILDDNMFELENNKAIALLFTRTCHHQNISVIFITQNIFHKGRYSRDISLNFSHLCLMNNPRDRSQISYLARQLCDNPTALHRVYKRIVQEKPYSYLFVDLHQNTHEILRFRTDILNPNYLTVFCPNDLPSEINDETVQHEKCGEGSAYSICLKKCQM